eukprot:7848762-Pyramimonas_sp.AAC.1
MAAGALDPPPNTDKLCECPVKQVNIASFYGSCANNGKDALNTPAKQTLNNDTKCAPPPPGGSRPPPAPPAAA